MARDNRDYLTLQPRLERVLRLLGFFDLNDLRHPPARTSEAALPDALAQPTVNDLTTALRSIDDDPE